MIANEYHRTASIGSVTATERSPAPMSVALEGTTMSASQAVAWCDDPSGHYVLTIRQRDVAAMLIRGYRVIEIARILALRTGTVRMHVKHLHERVGTRNLHSLALWCWTHQNCCLGSNGSTNIS